jgi:C1A family cysteine protease
MSPIKNQGMCASCWAFATTTVREAFISIQFRKTPVQLSSQALVDCYTEF